MDRVGSGEGAWLEINFRLTRGKLRGINSTAELCILSGPHANRSSAVDSGGGNRGLHFQVSQLPSNRGHVFREKGGSELSGANIHSTWGAGALAQ